MGGSFARRSGCCQIARGDVKPGQDCDTPPRMKLHFKKGQLSLLCGFSSFLGMVFICEILYCALLLFMRFRHVAFVGSWNFAFLRFAVGLRLRLVALVCEIAPGGFWVVRLRLVALVYDVVRFFVNLKRLRLLQS